MVVAMQGGQRSMFSIEAILSSKGDEEKNAKAARTNSIRDGSLIINDKSKIVEDGSRIIGKRTEFLGGTGKVADKETFTPSRTPLSRSVSPIDTAAKISPVTSPKSLRESSSPFEDDFIGKSMMFKDTSSLHSEYARSVRKDFLDQYTQSIRKDSLLDEEQLVKNSTMFGYDDDVFGKRYSQYNERSINPPTLERYDSPSCACQSCIERHSFSEKRKLSDQSFSSAEGYPSFSMHADKCGGGGSSKRRRTIFTMDQLERLENEFQVQQYLVGQERRYLAKELGLNEVQVKVWFQNRRIKWRKSTRHHRISIN